MNLTSLEFALTKHYQGQMQEYERILALVDVSRAAMQNGDVTDNSLSEVHELIQVTHQRDQSMNSIRDSWVATGNRPGPRLAEVLKQVEQLVIRVLTSVQEAETVAKNAKARLLPQLNQEATARKMHSAYAQASAYSDRPRE
jgi:hypothetical protein